MTQKRSFDDFSSQQQEYNHSSNNTSPATKKRRISFAKQLIIKQPLDDETKFNPHLHCTDFLSSQSQTNSLPFSLESQLSSQLSSLFNESQDIECNQQYRYAQNIPSVLLQHILSYCTLYELSQCCIINKHFKYQSNIVWSRLNNIHISPLLFPSLIYDDYDSQFEYNPLRHPSRTHNTLNWIISKLSSINNLEYLTISRTMMNGKMFGNVLKNCINLKELYLDENPWIFRGIELSSNVNIKLSSFIIKSMYINNNLDDITFNRLLSSSISTLLSLTICRRDPFKCSYCSRISLCKWHKCEDCQLRSYCNRECQSADWWQHQYVCSYHQPTATATRGNVLQLPSGFLNTICMFKSLNYLDLTWTYNITSSVLNQITSSCVLIENLILNGCDISDAGISAICSNLNKLSLLHCRSSRYITDNSISMLCNKFSQTLTSIDLSRCCIITKNGILKLMKNCNKLISLSIACGIKRGGWMWCFDDDCANSILNNLNSNKIIKLEYIYNNKYLSTKLQNQLYKLNNNNILINRIITDKRTALQIDNNGHLNVIFLKEQSKYVNPVKMQTIQNGKIIYQHRFRR